MDNHKILACSAILALLLVFTPVISQANDGVNLEEEEAVRDVLITKYQNLPGIEFNFDQPAASLDQVNLTSYSSLAISPPNLEGGLILGVVSYGETHYLLIATKLPKEMESEYGAGLIAPSTEQVEYVAGAQLEEQEEENKEISFSLDQTEGESNLLDLIVTGRKYRIRTVLPKNL